MPDYVVFLGCGLLVWGFFSAVVNTSTGIVVDRASVVKKVAFPREILALTPGYADMDFTRLPYRQVTRPIYPLDVKFDWHPIITNAAGYGEATA